MQPLVEELKRPAAYDPPVAEVGFLQTHISWLFFAGERVYKVKKPVDLGFLDFTDLARRRHFCEEEVRLNRRLAPRTYLGVVPITRAADGHLRVGGQGQALEWAVEMVRLPEARMFSNLLDQGRIDNEQMNSMATLLATFHATCATGAEVDEHGSPAAIAANVEENFEQLRDFVGDSEQESKSGPSVVSPAQYAFLCERGREFLGTREDLLQQRVSAGRIREGHGDLHAGNICFTDEGVVAYDCIEFNRRFRCGDVAADLAFLAMDLDYRGFPSFSNYLVKRYAQAAGDTQLGALMGFYKGYRAVVRGKVAAFTAADPGLDDAQRADQRRRAMRYLQLAAAYELPAAMILMCGLPACGKSWLARRLAGALRAAVLRSDVRRKLHSGLAPTARASAEYGQGLYTPERKREVYAALLRDTLAGLDAGHSVIVDASFSKREYRRPFVDAAARMGLPYYVVHVTASEADIRARLERRAQDPREASDADLEVYLHARTTFEAPSETPREHVLETVSGAGLPEQRSGDVIDRMIALRAGC